MTTTSPDTDRPVDNGVDVGALLAARDALTEAPEAADFTRALAIDLAEVVIDG